MRLLRTHAQTAVHDRRTSSNLSFPVLMCAGRKTRKCAWRQRCGGLVTNDASLALAAEEIVRDRTVAHGAPGHILRCN